jgi:hypothetical protein
VRAREVSAGPDAQDEAAFGDAVERGDYVRHRKWGPKQRQQDCGAERGASRRAGQCSEEGQRFTARTGQQGVADPQRVVAGLFCPAPCVDDDLQFAVCPQQGLARWEEKPGCGWLGRHR